jgi:hypothetical protein
LALLTFDYQFIVIWKGHEIWGKETYFKPWMEITQYADNIAKQLEKRFPSTDFLDALRIMNPQEWKDHRKNYTNGGI